MNRLVRFAAPLLSALFVAGSVVLACSSSTANHEFGDTPDAGAPEADTFETSFGGDAVQASSAHVTGKVFAPEGTIPISGALVYLTNTAPDDMPDGVACDKCVQLGSGTPYATTAADGSFSISASAGEQLLVVQKGYFRRVRKITLNAGDNALGKDVTSLPAKMDKANGDTIPKMAIIQGNYDPIEASLSKLGLGKVDSSGEYVDGSGSFDIYTEGNGAGMTQQGILHDPHTLAQYNIVFRPCSQCSDGFNNDSQTIKNLQDFVLAGGRFYVTDWSYEYVRQPWPQYLDFKGTSSGFGGGCISEYDAPATVQDQGMSDWLAAQGISNFQVKANWSIVEGMHQVQTVDPSGKPIAVTPKAWVMGKTPEGPRPTTVSFESGCGRVLFSTYHTEANGSPQLAPQELALLYVLLEVNVCVNNTQVN